MSYQLRLLADMSDIGEPGPLPATLAHLSDPELADLSWITSLPEYEGRGFFPVDQEIPAGRWLHKALLLKRIPAEKRKPIRAARASDEDIDDFLYLLESSDFVNLDDEDTVNGVGYLVLQGFLTQEEAEAVLA